MRHAGRVRQREPPGAEAQQGSGGENQTPFGQRGDGIGVEWPDEASKGLGITPTLTVVTTILVAVSITETLPLPRFATYRASRSESRPRRPAKTPR